MKNLSWLSFPMLLTASALAQPVNAPTPLPSLDAGALSSPVQNVRATTAKLELPPPAPAEATPAENVPAATGAPESEMKIARAIPVEERDLATRLQIFLDQQCFGPGKIDGRAKEFTLKALGRYQKSHGLPVTSALEDAEKLPLDSVYPVYTSYTIQADDLNRVGESPRKPEQQAKLKKMPYPDLLTFLEERFHSDPDFLRKINKGKDLEKLQVGDEVRVPNVEPFKIESVREVGKVPVVAKYKTRKIHVDTREKMLDLTEGDALIASFPITPGSEKLPAPSGTWRILGIATLPWFRHDEGVLNHGVRTSNFFNIPAGPTNPVGVAWIGLNRPGIGIHGTNQPLTIGRAGSHGCIRLANWDAIRLVGQITEGMTVVIDDGIPKPRLEAKLSSTQPLTAPSDKANKNAPQIPGRDTKYANH